MSDPGVLEQAADGVERQPATARRSDLRPANRGLPRLPQREVRVHARLPLSPNSGLGMNVATLPCRRRHVLDDVLVEHARVGHVHHLLIPQVDLRLPAGGDLVVMALDRDAHLQHHLDHLAAQVVVRSPSGGIGKYPSFCAHLVAEVHRIIRVPPVPDALDRNRPRTCRTVDRPGRSSTLSKTKNSISGPKYAVSAILLCLRCFDRLARHRPRVARVLFACVTGSLTSQISDSVECGMNGSILAVSASGHDEHV